MCFVTNTLWLFFFVSYSDADKGENVLFRLLFASLQRYFVAKVSEMWQRCTPNTLRLQGLISISEMLGMSVDIWVHLILAILLTTGFVFLSVQSLSPLGAALPKNWPLPLPNQMQGHSGSSIYRAVCTVMSSCSWAGQGGLHSDKDGKVACFRCRSSAGVRGPGYLVCPPLQEWSQRLFERNGIRIKN